MCSRGRKQPLWRDLPGIIQRDPSPVCGPEPTFHPEKRAQEPSSLTEKLLEREISSYRPELTARSMRIKSYYNECPVLASLS